MATTRIKQIRNAVNEKLLFVKLEDTENNRYLEPSPSITDVSSCTVPHVDSDEDFRKKAIAITSLSTAKVVGYIYQHKSKDDGDHLRFSRDGYHDSGYLLPGDNDVDGERDLEITLSGGNYVVTSIDVDKKMVR